MEPSTAGLPSGTGPLTPGTELHDGRFVITGLIGSGSQAHTLEALDKREGKLVALKCFQVRDARSWKDVELAEREATVLAGLTHSLLPRYVAHFEEGGSLYLALERIEGPTLHALREQGKLSQADVLGLLTDLAEVLDYLHHRSPPIVHRDIKPRNLIRRSDGHFVLVDFGSVRDRLKPEGGSTVVGTFGYMAPEQFQGRAMPASDVYAAGATVLSALTGKDPDRLPHRGLAIDVKAALGHGVDPRIEALLLAALEPDPDRRGQRGLKQLLQSVGLTRTSRLEANAPPNVPPRSTPDGRAEVSRNERRQERKAHKRFERAMRDPQRRARQYERIAEREAEQAQREAFEQIRHEHRMERHSERVPGVIAVGLILLFTVLRVVLGIALRVVLPTVLAILSVVFGPALLRAAANVRRAGHEAQRELRDAQTRLGRDPRELGDGSVVDTDGETVSFERKVEVTEQRVEAAIRDAERNLFKR